MNSLFEKIAKHYYTKAFQKKRFLDPNALYQKIEHLCILYPENQDFYHEADNVLPIIIKEFPNAKYTILKISDIPKDKMTFYQLPKLIFFENSRKRQFDLLIDLSPNCSFRSSYIVSQLEASLKVSLFYENKVDFVYDLFCRSSRSSLKEKITYFLKIFQEIRAKKMVFVSQQ